MKQNNNQNTENNVPNKFQRYREFVGWAEGWDILSAMQFSLLTFLGLKEEHYFLDIGCGSLRTGRLLIPYLLPGHYYGIEPEKWLIEEGIKNECGEDLIRIKNPRFSNDSNFTCTEFGKKFDFIYAHSVFTHASQTQIKRCISEVKKCMKPTSLFIATFLEGEKDYIKNEWAYPECITYTLTTMTKMVEEFRLKCHVVDWYHRNQTLLLLTYPETNIQFLDLVPKNYLVHALKLELDYCRKRIDYLDNHPYIKLGRLIKRIIKPINKLSYRQSRKQE